MGPLNAFQQGMCIVHGSTGNMPELWEVELQAALAKELLVAESGDGDHFLTGYTVLQKPVKGMISSVKASKHPGLEYTSNYDSPEFRKMIGWTDPLVDIPNDPIRVRDVASAPAVGINFFTSYFERISYPYKTVAFKRVS
eukprot:scaffold95826_cov49-Prasinocladus_malaysianus.AAC.1